MVSALPTQIPNSPQSFNVVLATGSGDFWVTSGGCTTCAQNTPHFNNTVSSTFQIIKDSAGQQIPYEIPYTDGIVEGYLVRDTVTMGGFQVQNHSWLLVYKSTFSLKGSNAGMMGLAFDTSNIPGITPFWRALVEGNKLTTPEMSFWLTRRLGDPNAQEEEFGGIFTLGGRNQTLYKGDVEFLPLVTILDKRTYWLLNMSST